jgi:hypothetical protein
MAMLPLVDTATVAVNMLVDIRNAGLVELMAVGVHTPAAELKFNPAAALVESNCSVAFPRELVSYALTTSFDCECTMDTDGVRSVACVAVRSRSPVGFHVHSINTEYVEFNEQEAHDKLLNVAFPDPSGLRAYVSAVAAKDSD